jgi:hypothetical protein
MNKSILTILREGCTITFPSGYIFNPDIEGGYIELKYDIGNKVLHKDGLEILDITGVTRAIGFQREFENIINDYE